MQERQTSKPRIWIKGLVPGILIGIGLLHTLTGLSAGRNVLAEIAREGFWDTVHGGPGPPSRPLLQWFFVSGLLLLMLGHLGLWVERHARRPLPSAFGVELLVFATVLGVLSGGAMPAWLFAAVGVYILVVARSLRARE